MDSFELNKIIAAVLLVALIIIGIGKLSDAIFYVEKPKTPGSAGRVNLYSVLKVLYLKNEKNNTTSHTSVFVF